MSDKVLSLEFTEKKTRKWVCDAPYVFGRIEINRSQTNPQSAEELPEGFQLVSDEVEGLAGFRYFVQSH